MSEVAAGIHAYVTGPHGRLHQGEEVYVIDVFDDGYAQVFGFEYGMGTVIAVDALTPTNQERQKLNVLQEAEGLINGQRAQNYGDVSENFERIAKLWGAYRGQFFDRHDVAQMMILVKVARQASGYHRDSAVDIAGYAALDEQVHKDSLSWAQGGLKAPTLEEWEAFSPLPYPVDLDVPAEDQFFIDYMTAPVQPRVWELWAEVPDLLVVEDVDGDHWIKTCDGTSFSIRWGGEGEWVPEPDLEFTRPSVGDAPYTEVVE